MKVVLKNITVTSLAIIALLEMVRFGVIELNPEVEPVVYHSVDTVTVVDTLTIIDSNSALAEEYYLMGERAFQKYLGNLDYSNNDGLLFSLLYWQKTLSYNPHHSLALSKAASALKNFVSYSEYIPLESSEKERRTYSVERKGYELTIWNSDSSDIVRSFTFERLIHTVKLSPDEKYCVLNFAAYERNMYRSLREVFIFEIATGDTLFGDYTGEGWMQQFSVDNSGVYVSLGGNRGECAEAFIPFGRDKKIVREYGMESYVVFDISPDGKYLFSYGKEAKRYQSYYDEEFFDGHDMISILELPSCDTILSMSTESLKQDSTNFYIETEHTFLDSGRVLLTIVQKDSSDLRYRDYHIWDMKEKNWHEQFLSYDLLPDTEEVAEKSVDDDAWDEYLESLKNHSSKKFLFEMIKDQKRLPLFDYTTPFSMVTGKSGSLYQYDRGDTAILFDSPVSLDQPLFWHKNRVGTKIYCNNVVTSNHSGNTPFYLHRKEMKSFSTTPNHKYAAVVNLKGELSLWNLHDSIQLSQPILMPYVHNVHSASFSSDGSELYVAYGESTPEISVHDMSWLEKEMKGEYIADLIPLFLGCTLDSINLISTLFSYDKQKAQRALKWWSEL